MSSAITLDFCVWLHHNFDALLEVMPEWHREYKPKPAPVLVPMPAPVQVKEIPEHLRDQQEAREWRKLRKVLRDNAKIGWLK